jgi:hypothetical protein
MVTAVIGLALMSIGSEAKVIFSPSVGEVMLKSMI